MMSEAQLWESNVLKNLRQVSEARGLKFYVNLPRDIIPDFLGNWRPDAIALGPDGGIIIEVKHRRTPCIRAAACRDRQESFRSKRLRMSCHLSRSAI